MEKKHLAVLAGVPLALSGCLKEQGAPVDYRGNITYGREANYDEKGNELPKYSAENPAKLDAKIADKYVEKKEEYSVAAEVPAVVEESPSLTNLKTSSVALTHAASVEEDAKNTVVADKAAPKVGFFDTLSSSASSLFGGNDDDKDLAQKPTDASDKKEKTVADATVAAPAIADKDERKQDAEAAVSALPSGVTIAAAPKDDSHLIAKVDPATKEIEFVANDKVTAASTIAQPIAKVVDKKEESTSGSFFSSWFKHDSKKEQAKSEQAVNAVESKDKPAVVASAVSVPAPATVITFGADKTDKKDMKEAAKADAPKQDAVKDTQSAKAEEKSGSFFSSLFTPDAKKEQAKSEQAVNAVESKDKPAVVASAVSVPAPATVITFGANKTDKKDMKEAAKADTPKQDAVKDTKSAKAEEKSGSFFSSMFKPDEAKDIAKGDAPAADSLHHNQLATAKPEPKKDVHVVKITKDDVLLSDKSDVSTQDKKDAKHESVASDDELKKAQELVAREMANVEAQKASSQPAPSYTKAELASAGQRSVEQSVAAPVTAVMTENDTPKQESAKIAVRMPVNKNIVLDTPSTAKSVIRLQDMQDAQTAQVADAAPEAASSQGQVAFMWPVKGKVVSAFGSQLANGRENDGVNIAANEGDAVAAAADGVVVYADSRLKGYGNMVVIQHEGGWLSAYAHASALQVQKGSRVRAGQSIATVGATGNVASPQLYFALRKNKQSYDPLSLIGKGA